MGGGRALRARIKGAEEPPGFTTRPGGAGRGLGARRSPFPQNPAVPHGIGPQQAGLSGNADASSAAGRERRAGRSGDGSATFRVRIPTPATRRVWSSVLKGGAMLAAPPHREPSLITAVINCVRRYFASPFEPPAAAGIPPSTQNRPLCHPRPPVPPALTSLRCRRRRRFSSFFPLFPPPSLQRRGAARTPPGLRREGGLRAEEEGRGEEKAANKQPHSGAGPGAALPRPPVRLKAGEGRQRAAYGPGLHLRPTRAVPAA